LAYSGVHWVSWREREPNGEEILKGILYHNLRAILSNDAALGDGIHGTVLLKPYIGGWSL